MEDAYSKLVLERRDDGVLVVALDNPPTNAIDQTIHDELFDFFTAVNHDPAVSVVVLTGTGDKAFSAGGDINFMRSLLDDMPALLNGLMGGPRLLAAMLRVERPVVARVNGPAIGAGATLALLCDIIYAADDAKIADPHISIGLVPGDGGALIWPHYVGYPRAREYLLTGDALTGRQAAEIGLISRSAPAGELDGLVYGMARRLAKGPRKAINLTKAAINMALRRQFEALLEGQMGLQIVSHLSDDHREAVAAFAERRRPNFVGR